MSDLLQYNCLLASKSVPSWLVTGVSAAEHHELGIRTQRGARHGGVGLRASGYRIAAFASRSTVTTNPMAHVYAEVAFEHRRIVRR